MAAIGLGTVFVALLGLIAVALVCVVVGLMLERQPLNSFVAHPTREPPSPGPYAETMNNLAAKEGFVAQGVYESAQGGRYRFRAWVWLSPQRDAVALICEGRIIHLRVRKTRLLTRTAPSTYLLSTDESELDLSGICDWRVLCNADFSELWKQHRDGLSQAGVTPQPFTEPEAVQAYHAFEAAWVRRLVERGYARFLDPARTWWRYTLKGDLKWLPASYTQLFRRMLKQLNRASLPRPGDAKYERRVPLDSDFPENVRFGGPPARFSADSPHLLLFDPMALDTIRDYFAKAPFPVDGPTPSLLEDLQKQVGLRLGHYQIENFEPGVYEIGPADFLSASEEPGSSEWFSIDTGTVVIADYAHLLRLVEVLSWDRYDALLQSPLGDDSGYDAVTQEVGGLYYAILSGNADTPFAGDGTYRLRPGAVRRAV